MYTKEQIYEQLKAAGAPQDSVVLMHTALRKVGDVEGRGEGLLDVLIRYFTEKGGLFCIPTHTWMNIDKKDVYTMDMQSDEVCIGTLPRLALQRPDGHRSQHPSHSMVVFGDPEKAELFISGEPGNDTPCGLGGCYGKLYDWGGYTMLLGVGLEKNTYMHSCEERLDIPGRVSAETVPMTIRLKDGTVVTRMMHHHIGGIPSDFFPKLEPAMRAYDVVTDLQVGDARAMILDARKTYEVMKIVNERSNGTDLFLGDEPALQKEWYQPAEPLMFAEHMLGILEADPADVVICDTEHKILYMNPAAVKHNERRGGKALIGQNLMNCHNERSKEAIQKILDWFGQDVSHNLVHTAYNAEQNYDLYMAAIRNQQKELIGYYEKHEYRNRETMPFYDLYE